MKNNKMIPTILIATLALSACSSNPYHTPPSKGKSASDYKREQLDYSKTQELGGAALSGLVGGLLGPAGILITSLGTTGARLRALNNYWSSVDNTELVGVVYQDVTKARNAEFLDHSSWFTNLPKKADLPLELNVDTGSGNSFVFPVKPDIHPEIGDVVTIKASSTTHKIMSKHADFFQDLPWIVEIRCKKQDKACIDAPENEVGVAKRIPVETATN